MTPFEKSISVSMVTLHLDAEIWAEISKFWNRFLKLGFTPCKAEQPLQGMELLEKETQKD